MKDEIYGFIINEEVLLDINKRRLVRFSNEPSINSMTFSVIPLHITSVRLLTLLLIMNGDIICKEEIHNNIWDANKLSSSSQRLWHAMNELRKKLSFAGLPDDFIVNVRESGYYINSQKVTTLFYG